MREPDVIGRSKRVWIEGSTAIVELLPSLDSLTHDRHELIQGTAELRLDFYEMAARRLSADGIASVFLERLGKTTYRAQYCPGEPIEVIVKNFAIGSTLRKYPGLFCPMQPFDPPVVKFDYRTDPEDQPIGEGYLRFLQYPHEQWRTDALSVNRVLRAWLAPSVLVDFCLVFGYTETGDVIINSEISPDCMRLRSPAGESEDKDLFREGSSADDILTVWNRLVERVRER